jgi:hypothetical protein
MMTYTQQITNESHFHIPHYLPNHIVETMVFKAVRRSKALDHRLDA